MPITTEIEATDHFKELLDRVSLGQEVVITQGGKRVARVAPEVTKTENEVGDAFEALLALRKKIAAKPGFTPLTIEEIRSAIEEGRR